MEQFLKKNRKLKLTLLYFLVVTIMLIIGKIDATGYLDFLKWSLGLFAGANAISKIKFGGVHEHTHLQNHPHNSHINGDDVVG